MVAALRAPIGSQLISQFLFHYISFICCLLQSHSCLTIFDAHFLRLEAGILAIAIVADLLILLWPIGGGDSYSLL